MSHSEPAVPGPAELLRRRLADDPSRPLVTYYDDARGERVELSARTFDNWVAKTANFLVDGLAAEPGGRVVLALPPHWQTAVWLMACWSAGLVAEPVDPATVLERDAAGAEPLEASGPYILAAAEEVLDVVLADPRVDGEAEEIVGLSLHPLGGPLADCPVGVTDYAAEVRSYGDRFAPGPEVNSGLPALDVTKTTLTAAELVAAARAAAAKWELDASSRVLVDMPFSTLDGVMAGLVAPLASGASVIIQRNFDKAALDRRLTLEHVTAVAGLPGWKDASGSVRRLG
ncbi:TIGR03089 family protein [Actinomadura nitritigenes]|uniref:TIGR03089 family protein n=1 Tax=Actinomadura nitritigenes TaxID=134602 RepID=A0ABS3R0X9_9ACTN|nr:TIGR03089 family protein [Actinomadura nitritigenes]MBO2439905.1 TIGR03089 family protein [Actinomadura nitritigenes]